MIKIFVLVCLRVVVLKIYSNRKRMTQQLFPIIPAAIRTCPRLCAKKNLYGRNPADDENDFAQFFELGDENEALKQRNNKLFGAISTLPPFAADKLNSADPNSGCPCSLCHEVGQAWVSRAIGVRLGKNCSFEKGGI